MIAGDILIHPTTPQRVSIKLASNRFTLQNPALGPITRHQQESIKFKGLGTALASNLPPPINVFALGLSMEDWTLRAFQWSFYIPQGIMAIKYRQHPIETWVRNIVIWCGVLGVVLFNKHPTIGINAIANQFFAQKENLRSLPKGLVKKLQFFNHAPSNIMRYLINPLRPRYNYYQDVLLKAGIPLDMMQDGKKWKGGFWSSLDKTKQDVVFHYRNSLIKQGNQHLHDLKNVRNFITRMFWAKFLAQAAAALLMAYVVGIALQALVIRLTAPLDRKFIPTTKLSKLAQKTIENAKGNGGQSA